PGDGRSGRHAGGLLVLRRGTERGRRTQRAQRGAPSWVGRHGVGIVCALSFVTLVSVVPFVSSVASARPGSIRGRVDLRKTAAPVERRPGVADLAAPSPLAAPDLLRSVVYLESAPRGAFETGDSGRVVMDQHNETFVPHVVAIMTGTTVDFPNSDPFYHNVFSLSKVARFDLGRYAAGRSRSTRFDKAG